jgi:uncharacterized membrane protein YkoI
MITAHRPGLLRGNASMSRKKWIVGGAVAVAVIGGGATAVLAQANSGDDTPLTGEPLEKATAAALAATGGGTVTETEVGDDGAAYGVEITLDDGRQVEVNLGPDFNVINQEADDDGSDGGPDDD